MLFAYESKMKYTIVLILTLALFVTLANTERGPGDGGTKDKDRDDERDEKFFGNWWNNFWNGIFGKPKPQPTPAPPVAGPAKCGVSAKTNKIVGGTKVKSAEVYPWMARLVYRSRTFCGATLVSENWVVSAAHCMLYPSSSLQVVLGDLVESKSDGEVTKGVSTWTKHSGWSTVTKVNDIAVLKLSSPVTFSKTIRPICLPCSYANNDMTGDTLTLAGWGTDSESGDMQDHLMAVSVPIISNAVCGPIYVRRVWWWTESIIKDTSLCAAENAGGKDSCSGDSGGPGIWVNGGISYLAGITSYGNGCARAGYPGVYTRVSKYVKWLEEKTGVNYCS